MKKNTPLLWLVVLAISSVVILATCKKSLLNTNVTVKLTDAPGPYDSVIVDVVKVEAHYSNNDDKGWEDMNTKAGTYDLLLLTNNVTEVLVDGGKIPAGKITQLRLVLGTNNYVVVSGVKHTLELSSQDKTGIKMQLNKKFSSNKEYEIVLDFDANKSIVETGSGKYQLKPVIEVKDIKEL